MERSFLELIGQVQEQIGSNEPISIVETNETQIKDQQTTAVPCQMLTSDQEEQLLTSKQMRCEKIDMS
jgi:hypothetical protein